MVERWKTEAMAAKRQRARGEISLSNKEEENYESDTGDETDPNQADNDKTSLQLWEDEARGSYKRWLN